MKSGSESMNVVFDEHWLEFTAGQWTTKGEVNEGNVLFCCARGLLATLLRGKCTTILFPWIIASLSLVFVSTVCDEAFYDILAL